MKRRVDPLTEQLRRIGDELGRAYPPDAHADAQLEALIERLEKVPGTKELKDRRRHAAGERGE